MKTAVAILVAIFFYGCVLLPFRSGYSVYFLISNQSLDMPAAKIVVKIDGEVIFEREAFVKNQHNWFRCTVRGLTGGYHLIEADEENTGAHQAKRIHLSRDLWVVIGFWYLKNKPLAGPPGLHIQIFKEKVHVD